MKKFIILLGLIVTGITIASGQIQTGGLAGTAGSVSSFPGGGLFNGGVNAQTGSSYAFVVADENKLVTFNNAGATAVTLSQATTTGFTAGAVFTAFNIGAGTVTITPATSTINGSATLVLVQNQGAEIISDGTNYSAWVSKAGTLAACSGDINSACSQVTNGSHITNSSIPNSGLVNTGVTVNPGSQTCTLGSSCTITLSAINPQTSTYQVLAADFSNYKTISVASGTFTITLVASGSQPANGQYIQIVNYGSGVVTVARSGQNINGGTTSLTLPASSATAPTSSTIWSDGTNYFADIVTNASGAITACSGDINAGCSQVTNGSHITNSSIPNSGLANTGVTVNPGAQTCTLGSSCSIPLSAINPQTGTYQVLAADFSNYKTISVASGTFTITLVASGSQPANGQYINIVNYGSGVVTIARSGQNINGGTTSLTLPASSATAPTAAEVWSDGTNYFANIITNASGAITACSGDINAGCTQVTNGSHITNSSIPNSGLVNTGTTVNGQTCTLGSSCTISLSAINPQTGTYQVLAGDFSAYKTITVASGTFTITLVASGSQPANGQYINIVNYGSGVVTIARSGQNINGGTTSLTLPASSATNPAAATVWSDGTNYFADMTIGPAVTTLASLTSANGTTIPSSATLTQTIASGTSAMGTGAISSATCATAVTTTATGTATTDAIIVTVNADPTATTGYVPSASGSLYIWAYPTSGNVNFKVCNNTSGSITPSAITLNWRVVR